MAPQLRPVLPHLRAVRIPLYLPARVLPPKGAAACIPRLLRQAVFFFLLPSIQVNMWPCRRVAVAVVPTAHWRCAFLPVLHQW